MQDTNPRRQVRDAVLATLSENVDDADTLTAVEDIVMDSAAFAAICGDRMVDFEDYKQM